MKKRLLISVLLLISAGFVFSLTPTAEELLKQVDDNSIFNSVIYEGEMIIEHRGRRHVKTMNVWARGNADSFIEFTNPEDRGTRYLRREGRLYMYSPDNEGVMLISGHMLRSSMMGSDMSYEDTINNAPLSVRYNAVIRGSEVLNGRDMWLLELNAIRRDESYPRRHLWIDKENGDLLRQELFALSGAKLKEFNTMRVDVIGARRFPVETEVRDLLRRDSRTIFRMTHVILDQPIPDSIFTMRNLER